jgi:hypothetical protein
MAKRTVTQTLKNKDGDILSLLNANESWSPRKSELVIQDIENDDHSYVIVSTNIPETAIHVVNGPNGKYLRTDHDHAEENNLDNIDTLCIEPPTFLGNYPSNKKSDWSDDLQGVTHSTDHWFFTQKTKIIKLHISKDVDTNMSGAVLVVHMPQELKDFGCNHFGDPDYIVFEDIGYLFVPLEEEGDGNHECSNEPRIAVFRDDAELTYIGFDLLSKQNRDLGTPKAGWCAFSPIDNILHTSHNKISDEFPVFRYKVNFEKLLTQNEEGFLEAQEDLILTKEGDTISIPEYIQGGCFSPSGFLFICNGKAKKHDEHKGGIRAFDQHGEFLYHSSINNKPFKYEYKPGFPRYQEPEGITYWNLDLQDEGVSAPNIEGQLHAILLNNRAGSIKDKIWFKHYRFDSLI